MNPSLDVSTWTSLRGRRGWVFDFTLGALAVLGQAPFHIWGLTLFSLALFKLRLDRCADEGSDGGFSLGLAYGLGYFFVGMFWIGSAFLARGGGYVLLMPPMILGLACLLAVFWAIAAKLYVKGQFTLWLSIAAFTSLFSLAELARGHVLGGLPWNLLGYIFPAGGPMSQSASFMGIYGLTGFACCIAAFLSAALDRSNLFWRRMVPICFAVAGVAGLYGFGVNRLAASHVSYVDNVRLRIVQVPFDQSDKFDPEKSIGIVNQFIGQSLSPGIEEVTHIIWPEGAVNGLALENGPLMQVMGEALLSVDDTPPVWLLQSLRHEVHELSNGRSIDRYFNTSAAVTFDQKAAASIVAYNDKSRLVPFGEFVPGGEWVQRYNIETLSTVTASLSSAPEKTHAQFPGLPTVSPRICYEIIFPGLSPSTTQENAARWILNQSNDAWYGRSIGPYQHYNQARYRAIEEGLPIVRAASNGISGVIDSYGRPAQTLMPEARGVVDVFLPQTIVKRVKIHNITLYLLLINLLVCLVCVSVRQHV